MTNAGSKRDRRRAAWSEEMSRDGSRAASKPPPSASEGRPREPYRLRAVGHSLGGASLLVESLFCTLDPRACGAATLN